MKIFLRLCAALWFMTSITLPSSAAASVPETIPPPPIEWGKISKADLEMRTFPKDTNASVVILCDYGDRRVNDDIGLTFRRHLRVKILNEKGFKWGSHSITYSNPNGNGEYVSKIEGVTYVLGKDGTIAEHVMAKSEIFKDEISKDRYRYRFTLPNLTPGCIIEIRYVITSKSLWYTRPWTFQHDEPVRWSEYRMLYPNGIAFAAVTHGYLPYTVKEKKMPKIHYEGDAALYFGKDALESTFMRWAMEDIPALREEPYITTLDDYYNKVELQVAGYAMVGGGVKKLLFTWTELVKLFQESESVGDRIETSGDVKDLAVKITAQCQSPLEKLQAVYSWVIRSITWNGKRSIHSDQSMDDVLERKQGNSADINYLLVSLLRSAGVSSDIIVLSTRGNGLAQEVFPIADQYDYSMALAKIDTTQYFLDATDPNRPYDIVPAQVQDVRALVINDAPKPEWVTVHSDTRSSTTILGTVTLHENGSLTGRLDGFFKEYANINVRSSLKDNTPLAVAKEYVALDDPRITIDSVSFVDKDSIGLALQIQTVISSESFAQSGGDVIYVAPHVVSFLKDNPFKSPTRMFPVDYNYLRDFTGYMKIMLPDSFEVKDPPRNKLIDLDGKVRYQRQFNIEGNLLQVISKFKVFSKEIGAEDYARLKEFYASVIQVEAEQVVLQKMQPRVSTAIKGKK